MKLAVMQPYLFPYIGYFQLICASDLFLIYDDVAYIKQGYINRNNILSASGVTRFTVPVPGGSSNKLISDLAFSDNVVKVIRTVEQSYSKAPYFDDVFPIIRGVMEFEDRSIASVCKKSYEEIFSYLGLDKEFRKTSDLEYERTSQPVGRLLSLCHKFGADCYINASGGRKLYSKREFANKGVDLKFIDSMAVEYTQCHHGFIPNLSMIDVLMSCSKEEVLELLGRYSLS
ncbi:WbqC family protein [Alcanivorax sp. S6407]|uniref:WbqC family protein n=1 Tax=Alcanivorax sp. S6407 TaxID=2926424 RepID=UPI001FF35E11|nr:WbqC family protein [Alcanivorax sp. S6407]MCK0152857.1 WbqC family protein [Alcanivorax sp. S6407]